jgi:hypothetical protein
VKHPLAIIIATFTLAQPASATVTVITNKAQWQNSVQGFTEVTFQEFVNGTVITDDYASLGINFTDGDDFVLATSPFLDLHGLVSDDGFGNLGMIHMSFTQPQRWIAFEWLGNLQVKLFKQGQLIYTSDNFEHAFTPFVGFILDSNFDSALAYRGNSSVVALDNIYFGPPIPAPSALGLLVLACVRQNRRRLA